MTAKKKAPATPATPPASPPRNSEQVAQDVREVVHPTSAAEIYRRFLKPFPREVIGWKPQVISQDKKSALAVPYIDARDVQDRLNEVLGLAGWQDTYQALDNGCMLCTLAILVDGEWITRSDVGGPSDQKDIGDKTKSAVSDALKRAAVKFGIGRHLYATPAVWRPYDERKREVSPPDAQADASPTPAPQAAEPGQDAFTDKAILDLARRAGVTPAKLCGHYKVKKLADMDLATRKLAVAKLNTTLAAKEVAA